MTKIEFLDELGRELDGAAGRLIRHQRSSRARGLLAPAAGLAVVAAIGVAVWPSGPADPEREVSPATETRSAEEALAVLRRPESEADRGPASREGREMLSQMLRGDATFRLVGTASGGRGVMLGAAAGVDRPVGEGGDPTVCVYHPDTVAGGVGCWPVPEVTEGRAYGSQGEHLFGLVPDEIVAVTVDTLDDSRRVTVRDNFWALDGAELPSVLTIVLEDDAGKRTTVHAMGVPLVEPVAVPEETLRKAEALATAELVPARKGGPIEEETEMLRQIEERIPLPPVPADRLDPNRGSGRGASIVAFEAYAERRAACLWQRYWLAATQAGNEDVAGEALAVLKTVPRWPALREEAKRLELVAFAAANGLVGEVARDTARECND